MIILRIHYSSSFSPSQVPTKIPISNPIQKHIRITIITENESTWSSVDHVNEVRFVRFHSNRRSIECPHTFEFLPHDFRRETPSTILQRVRSSIEVVCERFKRPKTRKRERRTRPCLAKGTCANQPIATVTTEQPRSHETAAIFAIGLLHRANCIGKTHNCSI